jgi:hypothetical protein
MFQTHALKAQFVYSPTQSERSERHVGFCESTIYCALKAQLIKNDYELPL